MAGENPTPVGGDLASAPAANEHMTLSQGDDAIAEWLGDLGDEPDPAEETEGNDSADEPDATAKDETEDDTEALTEDVEDDDAEEPDTSSEYAEGRFAADNANVKLEDGTTISVAELKRNNLFQRDYSKKTEELAREREAVTAREQEFSQLQETLAQEREYVLWYAQTHMPQEPKAPEVSAQQDPMAWLQYQEQMRNYGQVVSAWQAMHQGKQAEEQRLAGETKAQMDARIAQERDALFSVYPALKDDKRRAEWFDETFSEAEKNYGFSKKEMAGIQDHRMLKVLRDANLYRRAKAKAPAVQKDVQSKPAMVQGSGRRQSPEAIAQRDSKKVFQRLRETGSERDADAAILKWLS